MPTNQVAHLTQGVINSGYGELKWRLGPGGICEIVDIEVKSEHRREGEGRYLLCLLLQEMSQPYHKVYTVYAFCREENRIAREWYTACGFCLYHLPDFYGTKHNAYCCTLRTDN